MFEMFSSFLWFIAETLHCRKQIWVEEDFFPLFMYVVW